MNERVREGSIMYQTWIKCDRKLLTTCFVNPFTVVVCSTQL